MQCKAKINLISRKCIAIQAALSESLTLEMSLVLLSPVPILGLFFHFL